MVVDGIMPAILDVHQSFLSTCGQAMPLHSRLKTPSKAYIQTPRTPLKAFLNLIVQPGPHHLYPAVLLVYCQMLLVKSPSLRLDENAASANILHSPHPFPWRNSS